MDHLKKKSQGTSSIAATKAGLSWRRNPFLNQWMVVMLSLALGTSLKIK